MIYLLLVVFVLPSENVNHFFMQAEEKMRVTHGRKQQKLKRLDERGAETKKVDSTQTLIRSLSAKMRISIQAIDKISVTINKIRDDELWPQLNDLIKGYVMELEIFTAHRLFCFLMHITDNGVCVRVYVCVLFFEIPDSCVNHSKEKKRENNNERDASSFGS